MKQKIVAGILAHVGVGMLVQHTLKKYNIL